MTCFGLVTRKYGLVALKSTSAEVVIQGFVAHLSIKLVYANISDNNVEVTYVCPVDAKSALYSFEAKLDGRKITAHCLEREKAKKTYENAVKQGHTAILASEDEFAGDIIHLSLGNLPKGETAELELKLCMELPVGTDGGVNFTLPTLFNPRYCPAGEKSGPSYHDYASSSRGIVCETPYSLEVKGEVRGSHKIANVTSNSDPITVKIGDDGTSAVITQDGGSNFDHDWNFRLYYQTVHKPQVLQMTGDRSGKGLMKDDVLMVNLFPEIPVDSFSPHNEIIFVVDRSGSMDGSNITQAKNTLLLFLKSLPFGCRFNVISFGDDYSALFEGSSERYAEKTLEKALKLQKSMKADMGGTEILEALKHVYSKDLIPGYFRQMIVLTDGEVWNLKSIFDLVSRHAHETRVFAVGIGHGASTALVQGIAKAGRGRYEMVADESQLQIKVMGLVASMLQESVSDLRVEIEAEPSQEISLVPRVPPVVFGGQHLILYARIAPKTTINSLTVVGKIGDREIKDELKGKDCQLIHDSNFTFHRLAAKKQLTQWEMQNCEYTQEMIDLSVSSNVVCKATAFVGIDQDRKTIQEENEADDSSEDDMGCGLFDDDYRPLKYTQKMNELSVSSNVVYKARASVGQARKTIQEENEADDSSEDDMGCGLFDDDYRSLTRKFDYRNEESEMLPKPSEETNIFLEIVSLQKFDGSWDLRSCQENIGVSDKDIKKIQSKMSLDDTSLATALILAFLQIKFDSRKTEWHLLFIKGKTFLQSKGNDATRVIEEITQELKSILK